MNTDILTVYSSHFTKCLAWIRQLHSTMLCCYAKPNLRISTTILSPSCTYTNCCTFLLFSLPTLNRISSFPISVSKKPCLQIFHHWLTNGVPPLQEGNYPIETFGGKLIKFWVIRKQSYHTFHMYSGLPRCQMITHVTIVTCYTLVMGVQICHIRLQL